MKMHSVLNPRLLVIEAEKYIRSRLPQYIKELSELCLIDSNSYYKPGLDEMARYLYARMRDLGMETTIIDYEKWGNDVFGILRGNGRRNVLLLGHTDTVYPVGTAASRPVRIEGDMLLGPGVSDMKGCILSAIYAIEALVAMDFHLFGEVRFLCVSDEEISDRHSTNLLQKACQNCHRALVLESGRADGNIVSARKGFAWYSLTAHGRSAHAGAEPEKGCNAIVEIANQIVQFQSLNGWREGVTVNIGVISGGTAPNVVPDFANASIDLRYMHFQDRIATEELWYKIMQQKKISNVELTLNARSDFREQPMVCTPESLELVNQAQDISHWLDFPVDHVFSGGCSDANYTSSHGVPTLDGLGPIGGLDHSPDEYLMVNSIASRAALLAGLIATVDG